MIMMPIKETLSPNTIAHDSGSPNINQAQIMVTGGLRYKIAVTRVGDDFFRAM